MAEYIQLFGEKYQISFLASSAQFYFLHRTLLIIHERIRRKLIANGRTVVAYLPTIYNKIIVCAEICTYSGRAKRNATERVSLQATHKSNGYVLGPRRDIHLQGLRTRTEAGRKLLLHLVIACYICDIPEAEDLLELKRDCRTFLSGHICFATGEQFSRSTTAAKKTLEHTRRVLDIFHSFSKNTKALHKLRSLSIHSLLPALSEFYFSRIHPCINVYSSVWIESRHSFSLGIG